jgi:uncharacterized protein (DUF488 family)
MFYRRKILLAILEVFGGQLGNLEMQKLTFLFCQKSGNNFYDFFPHKYGCFSFSITQDKKIMTNQGLLLDVDKFKQEKNNGFLFVLKKPHREELILFARKMRDMPTDSLIKQTYLEYPEYTKRSTIIDKYFSPEEKRLLAQSTMFDFSPEKVLYTLGYEGRSIDAYLNKLIQNDIQVLVDVRKNPKSMKFDFNKSRLKSSLNAVDIEYVHIPELGIDADLRQNLDHEESYIELFKKYEQELLPKASDKLEAIKSILDKNKRIALTCFEKSHLHCHRHKVADKMLKLYPKEFEIINI